MNIKQDDFDLKTLLNDMCQGHFVARRCLAECLIPELGIGGYVLNSSDQSSMLGWGWKTSKIK